MTNAVATCVGEANHLKHRRAATDNDAMRSGIVIVRIVIPGGAFQSLAAAIDAVFKFVREMKANMVLEGAGKPTPV